jgi:hypothetical protein
MEFMTILAGEYQRNFPETPLHFPPINKLSTYFTREFSDVGKMTPLGEPILFQQFYTYLVDIEQDGKKVMKS